MKLKLYISCLILTSIISMASDVSIPNTFVAHQPAVAAEVNANFTAVKTITIAD